MSNLPHPFAASEVEARQGGQAAERPHGAVGDGAAVRHVQALQVLWRTEPWIHSKMVDTIAELTSTEQNATVQECTVQSCRRITPANDSLDPDPATPRTDSGVTLTLTVLY